MSSTKTPSITPNSDGPFLVRNFRNFANQDGTIESKETMALCRCGESANKPFCDGTHKKIGFSSAKIEGRVDDRRDTYVGGKITIHDNRGICAHAGKCTDGLASVFRMKEEPWIHADSASRDEIIATIQECPSGALSYSIDDLERVASEVEPGIFIAPNGPYVVSGDVDLIDTTPAAGASKRQITLCRCGGSKNKPFCDGSHWNNKFTDDMN